MKMKKLAALALAAVMTMGMATTAMAATITIENDATGETYTAYKLFDVTNSGTAYSYTIPGTTSTELKTLLETAGFSFTASADGSVFYVNNATSVNAASAAATLNENITTLASLVTGTNITDNGTIDAGYYFVDTTLGSLCALQTATDSITIYEKNSIPSVTKKVKNGSDNEYADWADIDVVDTIDYKVTVNTGTNSNAPGTGTGNDADITLVDTVPAGVTLSATDGNYITISGWTKGTDYTESYDTTTNKLTVVLLSSKVSTLAQNTNIDITYSATVTNADTFKKDGSLNKNTVELTYKEQSDEDFADVVSYQITGDTSFTKVDGTTSTALEGVGFTLQKAGDGYVTVNADGILTGYVENYTLNKDNLTQSTGVIFTDATGKINVKGLDAGTYVLTEVYALPGYNMLDSSKTIVISGDEIENGAVKTRFTVTMGDSEDAEAQSAIGSQNIANMTGSVLPSTGGIGTTIFYVVGGILVLGAGVVLVAKKRMNHEA